MPVRGEEGEGKQSGVEIVTQELSVLWNSSTAKSKQRREEKEKKRKGWKEKPHPEERISLDETFRLKRRKYKE